MSEIRKAANKTQDPCAIMFFILARNERHGPFVCKICGLRKDEIEILMSTP